MSNLLHGKISIYFTYSYLKACHLGRNLSYGNEPLSPQITHPSSDILGKIPLSPEISPSQCPQYKIGMFNNGYDTCCSVPQRLGCQELRRWGKLPHVPWNGWQGDTGLQGMLGFFKESKLGSVKLPCFSSAPSFSALRDEPVPDLWSAWTVHQPHDYGDLVPCHPHFTFRGIFLAPPFQSEALHFSSGRGGQGPNIISISATTNSSGPSPVICLRNVSGLLLVMTNTISPAI